MMKPGPAPRPCDSCPYRRDVPAGLWAAHEYEKLPEYDQPMIAQPHAAFFCHQQDGRMCAGWAACHLAQHHGHVLAIRIMRGSIDMGTADIEAYTTDVPLFESGEEAALHGLSGIDLPDESALAMIRKLQRRAARKA